MTVAVLSDRPELIDWTRLAAAGSGHDVVTVIWHLSDQPHPAERLAKEFDRVGALVIVIGPDVPFTLALDVAQTADRELPGVSTIVIGPSVPDAWRAAAAAGVRELIDSHAVPTDLAPAIVRALERSVRSRSIGLPPPTPTHRGRVLVVASPKGGCGKTTVSTNLAVAIAATHPGRVVLVDLDLAFGDVAPALGQQVERTMSQLVNSSQVDSTAMKVFLTPYEPGLFVLYGSGSPEEGDAVTDEHVTTTLALIAREFDFVVVDTPAGLDSRALAALEMADDVVLVASFDVSTVRSLKQAVETLDRLQINQASRYLVLNRADSKVGLDVADVERVVGLPVTTLVPSTRAIPLSMNLGIPIVVGEPDSKAGKQFASLAALLAPAVNETSPGRRRWKGSR